MNPVELALRIFAKPEQPDRWLRLRHAFPAPRKMVRALRRPGSSSSKAALEEHIVVVGTGWASLAFIRALDGYGYKNITIIARDELYGGKCVNFGCMPTEFVLSQLNKPLGERTRALQDFVASLRADVEAQFQYMRVSIVRGCLEAVEGKVVRLTDGTLVPFDRLALATGSNYPLDTITPPRLSKLVSIEEFWKLPPGSRVALYGGENASVLSLGMVAKALGLEPAILLSGNPLGNLPSMRHLIRRIADAGVSVKQGIRPIRVDEGEITFVDQGNVSTLAYDYLLWLPRPTPWLPPIDGKSMDVFELDFGTASFPSRPDITMLGDGAGYFTASEAEAQADSAAHSWATGERLDLEVLASLPITIEGPEPLCIVGAPWTLASRAWAEVDFRSIGWSKVHQDVGKLWYLLDPQSERIEAIHICHANAKDLIATAALLLNHPVTSQVWMSMTVHPSSAEIFRVVATHARKRLPPRASTVEGTAKASFKLPDVLDLSPGGDLPTWLKPDDVVSVLTSANPRKSLARCFVLAKLGELTVIESSSTAALSPPVISYDGDCRVRASSGPVTVSVEY